MSHPESTEIKTTLSAVAVFCGASTGNRPEHMALAKTLGESIAARSLRLIYGGGGLGLMGAVARATHSHGGDVLGVIPEALKEVEALLRDVKHEIVPDMHARKIRMYTASDAFIALPGGIGTLEEAIEVLSWQYMNLHDKPTVFLSDTGYWDNLVAEFNRIIDAGFAKTHMKREIMSARTVDEAFELIHDRLANPVIRPPLDFSGNSVETLA